MIPRGLTPWFGGAVLLGCAVFISEPLRAYALIGVMLFFPLADIHWKPPRLFVSARERVAFFALASASLGLLAFFPFATGYAVRTLFFAAWPEEWFFRAYLLAPVAGRNRWPANLLVSVLFAVSHWLVRHELSALLVFFPSMAFGWLYLRTRSLVLVIAAHVLANLFHRIFIPWL